MPASEVSVVPPREGLFEIPSEKSPVEGFLSAPNKERHSQFLHRVQQMLFDQAFQVSSLILNICLKREMSHNACLI